MIKTFPHSLSVQEGLERSEGPGTGCGWMREAELVPIGPGTGGGRESEAFGGGFFQAGLLTVACLAGVSAVLGLAW